MSDRLALANAIEDAGIERSKAERVASVIVAAIYDHAATKVDVQASETAVRADIAQLAATTRADLATMRGDLARVAATTQADVQASEAAIRGELRTEIASVRALFASETARLDTRIERLDAKVEQIGSRTFNRLGALMVVLTGIILAALRYLPPPGH
jgi:hypothetical protein